MSTIAVPYHLDEFLPDLELILPPGRDVRTVVETLPVSVVWTRLALLQAAVADAVEDEVRANRPVWVLAGDCVTAVGTMAGVQRAGVDAAVVWFDAHGDVQTLETTASGYIGGMPLRMLVGYRPDLLTARIGVRPVAEDRVLLVDARDLDPPEVEYLETAGIARCAVDEVDVNTLPSGPLLLHLDLDVVDTAELVGLRYPAVGGPSASAVLDAARRVLDTNRVAAVSVACTWYPDEPDPDGTRTGLLARLLA